MMTNMTQKGRAAATAPAQEGRSSTIRKVWRWLTGASLSADEIVRMTMLYTEIL